MTETRSSSSRTWPRGEMFYEYRLRLWPLEHGARHIPQSLMCIYVCMHALYVCMDVCMYVCMCLCMCVCMYACRCSNVFLYMPAQTDRRTGIYTHICIYALRTCPYTLQHTYIMTCTYTSHIHFWHILMHRVCFQLHITTGMHLHFICTYTHNHTNIVYIYMLIYTTHCIYSYVETWVQMYIPVCACMHADIHRH